MTTKGTFRGLGRHAVVNAANEQEPQFFTVSQVSEFAGVSPRSVRRWIKDGELIVHRFGGAVRVADSDLKTFFAQHRES